MSFEACFWVELFSLPFPRFFVPFGVWLCFCGCFSGWVLVVLVCVGFLLFLCGFFCGGFGGHGVGVYT